MSQKEFFYRRLHSLLGVIPVGFFLIEHLVTNWYATKGEAAFLKKVAFIQDLPFILALEILFIFLPILYHGIYGLYIAFQAKNNVGNYGYFRNILFMLQRVTGVVTLLYIGWHVWQTRLQVALGNVAHEELGQLMNDTLANPITFTLYAIGLVAAVFHFSNGMWSFLVSWGITVGPRSQRISTYVWLAVFVIVTFMGMQSLFAFADSNFLESNAL